MSICVFTFSVYRDRVGGRKTYSISEHMVSIFTVFINIDRFLTVSMEYCRYELQLVALKNTIKKL